MDRENTTPPTPDDDVSDEELAAALALIKKRRADEARQREQQAAQQQPQQQIVAAPVPRVSAAPAASPTNSTTPSVWPPSPVTRHNISSTGRTTLVPPELPTPILGTCPSCKRKLLTRTSALCNWCGAKINNPDYQEQAARTRQEMDDAIRQAADLRAQDAPNRTVLGRLKRRLKPGGTSAPQT